MLFRITLKHVAVAAVTVIRAATLSDESLGQQGMLALSEIIRGPYHKPNDPARPPEQMYARPALTLWRKSS